MSQIRAANLIRCYFSGTCAASPSVTVVGIQGDTAGFVTNFVPCAYGTYGAAVPIQWEIKNGSSVPLEVAFSGTPTFAMTASAGSLLANYITLNALEAFTQQKRHYPQEYSPGDFGSSLDLTRMYVRGTTGAGAFSGTVDLWIPLLGA